MSVLCNSRHRFLLAAAAGGIAAGILSTLVQVALWLIFTDAFPGILWRDARLTAALVLGSRVLPPPESLDWASMAVATLIHFGLSVIYGLGFAAAVRRRSMAAAWLIGALGGVALYLVNLYGFTLWFPWFAAARGGITLAAHIAFGVTASGIFKWAATKPPINPV